MNLEKIYREEDLFPREMVKYEEREYGLLFYDENNKDSFDSNHAVIFRNKVSDIEKTLEDITRFYSQKETNPIIYQATAEEGYFREIQDAFTGAGFDWWEEEQKYMTLSEQNRIVPNPQITVKKVTEWDPEYETEIFEAAGEPWEIDVAKNAMKNSNVIFLVAYYENKPVGMVHVHVRDGVCRGDYLLVSKKYRKIGVGRALMYHLVEYCKSGNIENFYLWVEKETAERIYIEAGFREIEVKKAARAAKKTEEDIAGKTKRFDELTLINYCHPDCTPLLNIMRLPKQEAFRLAKELAAAHPETTAFYRFGDFDNYYALREAQDKYLYSKFMELGGMPKEEHPLSFVIEGSEYLKEWFGNGIETRLPLKDIAPCHISFTIGDSGAEYDRNGSVDLLTMEELRKRIDEYGGDFDAFLGATGRHYIEVQLWSDEYLGK